MRERGTGSTRYRIWCALVGAVLLTASLLVAASGDPPAFEIDLYRHIDGLWGPIEAVFTPATAAGGLVIPILLLVAAMLWARSVRFAVTTVAAGLVSLLAAEILKRIVERGRPCAFVGEPACSELGFPSATTALAFAVAATVATRLPRGLAVVAFVLASMVGFGRVLIGAHLPADVIGGAGLGLLVAAVILACSRDVSPVA